MSCSAAFNLLSHGEEYLLADLLAKDLLPMNVRFVDPVLPEVRETFFEENHDKSLGVFYLEKKLIERCGVEATFNDLEKRILTTWLPCDLDITVSLMASDTPIVKSKRVHAALDIEFRKNTDSKGKNSSVLLRDDDSQVYERVGGSESEDEQTFDKLKNALREKATGTLRTLKKIDLCRRKSKSNIKATGKELLKYRDATSSVTSLGRGMYTVCFTVRLSLRKIPHDFKSDKRKYVPI